jgi:hypothetical protein
MATKIILNESATLSQHANAIRKLIRSSAEHAQQSIDDYVESGRRLKLAKDLVGHGKWGQWLKDEFELGETSAQKRIRAYEFNLKSGTIPDLPVRSLCLIAEKSTPKEAVKEVTTRAKAGEKMTPKKVKEVIKKTKEPTTTKAPKPTKPPATLPATSPAPVARPAEQVHETEEKAKPRPVCSYCGEPSDPPRRRLIQSRLGAAICGQCNGVVGELLAKKRTAGSGERMPWSVEAVEAAHAIADVLSRRPLGWKLENGAYQADVVIGFYRAFQYEDCDEVVFGATYTVPEIYAVRGHGNSYDLGEGKSLEEVKLIAEAHWNAWEVIASGIAPPPDDAVKESTRAESAPTKPDHVELPETLEWVKSEVGIFANTDHDLYLITLSDDGSSIEVSYTERTVAVIKPSKNPHADLAKAKALAEADWVVERKRLIAAELPASDHIEHIADAKVQVLEKVESAPVESTTASLVKLTWKTRIQANGRQKYVAFISTKAHNIYDVTRSPRKNDFIITSYVAEKSVIGRERTSTEGKALAEADWVKHQHLIAAPAEPATASPPTLPPPAPESRGKDECYFVGPTGDRLDTEAAARVIADAISKRQSPEPTSDAPAITPASSDDGLGLDGQPLLPIITVEDIEKARVAAESTPPIVGGAGW